MPRPLLPSRSHQNDEAEQIPNWGRTNKLRGRNFADLAIKFKLSFPEGAIFTQTEFDQWAAAEGLFSRPLDEDKKADAWLAHLQRRHQLRHNLNKAATHPRMNDSGIGAYFIAALRHGMYTVVPPHERIAAHELTDKINSLVHTKRRQLNYLMQSADWTLVPPYERIFAEALYDDIDGFAEDIDRTSKRLNTKFRQLADKLKKAVESGEIHPNNGGIRQLIAPPPVNQDGTLEADNEAEDEDASKPAQEAVVWDEEEPYC